MWSDVKRLIRNLIFIVLPVLLLLQVICRYFPNFYFDGEYAMYQQQIDLVQDSTVNYKTLIIGDSRTKAGFLSSQLGSDCYNLALGGTTPIEGYYTIKEYLQHHEKPENIILCYAPMHYMQLETLWTRSVYFHTLSFANMQDIFKNAKNYEGTEEIYIENYQLELMMYEIYAPNKYAGAISKALMQDRYSSNKALYEQLVDNRGHAYFGLASGSGDINFEAKQEDFEELDIITAYLQKIIDLCNENDIKLIIEQLPMNETSYQILQRSFKTNYREYMQSLALQNTNITIYADFYCYPNEYFGDADHLNERGAMLYSDFMKSRYKDVFTD